MTQVWPGQVIVEALQDSGPSTQVGQVILDVARDGTPAAQAGAVHLESLHVDVRPVHVAQIFLEYMFFGETVVMTGIQGTGEVGNLNVSISADIIVSLTGVEGVGQVGLLTVLPTTVVSLTGVEGTGQVGTTDICIIQDIWVANPQDCSDDWREIPNA